MHVENKNPQNMIGTTPLHLAAESGHLKALFSEIKRFEPLIFQ